MDYYEMSISSIACNISYEKLILFNERKFEEILNFQQSSKNIKKIADDCIANLEKNILKNYSLLICIDKVVPFKDKKIFDSIQLEEIFYKFKKDFLNYKENYVSNHNGKDESKNDNLNVLPQSEQIEKRLEFLKFLIKILAEFNLYNILKKILTEKIFLNQEKKRQYICQFIDEFKEKREYLFNKEEINFYEFLILEFNHLENNLEYIIKNIENNNFKYEIILFKEIENIKYLNDFILSFSKQKDKDVIEEMKIFILNFYMFWHTNLLDLVKKYIKDFSIIHLKI